MPDTRRTLSALQALLADNTAGDISAQDTRDQLVSSHPENSVKTGADASTPASDRVTGDLYLPNDGFHVKRFDGTTWQTWGPIFPMTPPVDGDFAWVNQGGASVDTTKGGIFLSAPANASSSWRCRVKTAPATPYTITAWFIPQMINVGTNRVALIWRESGTGELVTVEFTSPGNLAINTWSSPSSFSGAYGSAMTYIGGIPICLRLADNGTNRSVSWSHDGQNFIQIHTIGRTDHLTADQVGFAADPNTATYSCGMTLLSWKEE